MTDISYTTPRTLLTPTGGFLEGYTHSLNPYTGCSFGCSYCYVRRSPVGLFRKQAWGTWVDVKQDARERLSKDIAKLRSKGKRVTIFMSSSTDPYQPIEYREKVTRSLLEAMIESPPDFLFVQTRSPLVVRDIDLYEKLRGRLRISVTVETDLEPVRKTFTPYAPPIQARLRAVRLLREQRLPVQIAVAPVLPFSERFGAVLSDLVDRIVIDDFVTGDGSGGKRTEKLDVRSLYTQAEAEIWYGESVHARALERLKASFEPGRIRVSREGFLPDR